MVRANEFAVTMANLATAILLILGCIWVFRVIVKSAAELA